MRSKWNFEGKILLLKAKQKCTERKKIDLVFLSYTSWPSQVSPVFLKLHCLYLSIRPFFLSPPVQAWLLPGTGWAARRSVASTRELGQNNRLAKFRRLDKHLSLYNYFSNGLMQLRIWGICTWKSLGGHHYRGSGNTRILYFLVSQTILRPTRSYQVQKVHFYYEEVRPRTNFSLPHFCGARVIHIGWISDLNKPFFQPPSSFLHICNALPSCRSLSSGLQVLHLVLRR